MKRYLKQWKKFLCVLLIAAMVVPNVSPMVAYATPADTELTPPENPGGDGSADTGTELPGDPSGGSEEGEESEEPGAPVMDDEEIAEPEGDDPVVDIKPAVYENYRFGDPDNNGTFTYGYEADGTPIPEVYCQDLDEIVQMAEEGMDLKVFFTDTVFSDFTLSDLYTMQEEGWTLGKAISHYLYDYEMPDWLAMAFARSNPPKMATFGRLRAGGPTTLTSMESSGISQMSNQRLGVIPSLGGTGDHGPVYKLRAKGNDGATYGAYCATYGASYRRGYSYEPFNPVQTGDMTMYQYNLIRTVINTYVKATGQQDLDFAAAQLIIWYIIQNMPDDTKYFDPDYAWTNGGMQEAAIKIGGVAYADFIRRTILSYSNYINQWWDAGANDGALEHVNFNPDYMPGQLADIQFWRTNASNFQWIITWAAPVATGTTFEQTAIPYIDNIYIEKEAKAKYHVEVTKEAIITNELLEGVRFEVVESEADGYDLDYDIYQGTMSSYGSNYMDAKVSTFGQATTEEDEVSYMDDDVKPSDGAHKTIITTDEKGYAKTTFVHEHTFKQFYSNCYNGNNQLIDKATYDVMWEDALKAAEEAEATEAGATIEVAYKGSVQEMTLDQIKDIKASQTTVYTQTMQQAQSTLDDLYSDYMDRTYTYTVTELDSYTRPSATDSNGNALAEIALPKDGYRKDVADATTIGSYEKEVANGRTMTVGGTNDEDPNTTDKNVTNEPWQNQIFINKTDLESNNQILYDTDFEIYEYYRYDVTLKAAEKVIDLADQIRQFETKNQIHLDMDTVEKAVLKVTDSHDDSYLKETLDVAALKDAVAGTSDYTKKFTPDKADTYKIVLELTLNQSLSDNNKTTKKVAEGKLVEIVPVQTDPSIPIPEYPKSFTLQERIYEELEVTATSTENLWNVVGGGTVKQTNEIKKETITVKENGVDVQKEVDVIVGPATYEYTDANGIKHTLKADADLAGINAKISVVNNGAVTYYFTYAHYEDTQFTFKTEDGTKYTVEAADGTHISDFTMDTTNNVYTISWHVGEYLEDGLYKVENDYPVAPNDLHVADIDRNVNTDPADYKTWGQENYEIVRVTSAIAKQMGWSDKTIGMYTIHRKNATDAYCGTTFTSAKDHATGETFGYQEYGTLYYTQANLGQFAIVEKEAPSDSSRTGYLGNYEDRTYDYLKKDGAPSSDMQSSSTAQKNYNGTPVATDDSMSVDKYVHYIDLCTDTNQYATYMLTDGHAGYTASYYNAYVEKITDEYGTEVETGDGYDAVPYDQSSLKETVGLQRFKLDGAVNDILNTYWDNQFSQQLTNDSGITVVRDSEKTDTWMKENGSADLVHHYVGTTINVGSYDNNDSRESDIVYEGTYTDTHINYNTYASDAEELNARDGFNGREFLQAGAVTYDNGALEKQARFYHTQASVDHDRNHSFIDEREYGYIRFSKYDAEAGRYVDGDLEAGYESGTDHADADLDGAVYSLYVDETNSFDVEYLEGTYDGKLFWAQPLNTGSTNGGYKLIFDADENAVNGFTDSGENETSDYPLAYVKDGKLYLDYTDDTAGSADVVTKTQTYLGIQHPDGQYGGEKHNGFFAVLEEQQVFIDTNNDGFADTWTLQDVTLYNGAKVASAVIRDGELSMDGLYLGNYYIVEEIRDAVTIWSSNSNDEEASENRWLSFAPGYTADTDEHGNPVKYTYSFPYVGQTIGGTTYLPEQDYVHKDTDEVSMQQVVKGGAAQFNKITTGSESSGSHNTTGEALEGAGFSIFLISELSLIKDGTIVPAYTEADGHKLVEENKLVKLFDKAGNLLGYEFTKNYMRDVDLYSYFDQKYPDGYELKDVNQIIYVRDRGYYYVQDILDGYRNAYYDQDTLEWDFTGESDAIARIYEDDANLINEINSKYDYVNNHLNNGSPCEWYGVNGLSDGWVATGVKNEYKLSEIFTNHNGNLRTPDLAWGAYIMVETTTPTDVFTVDPVVFAITDMSALENKSKTVTLTDASFVASLVLVKRDAQSGQDVAQDGISYRIWDYDNNRYVSKYLLGENGGLSVVAQRVFETDKDGRINAVASLELGKYRIEELGGPKGLHNTYWDYGNGTVDELLGGLGLDKDVPTEDNMFQKYFGTLEFEVTTDRRYKSSGIVSSDNLDYIYIGENYYNDEVQGKLTITKTGEVLVGYETTDGIEYADEFKAAGENGFNYSKSMIRERSVFESMKDHYDLGTDEIMERTVEITGIEIESITDVDYFAINKNGMNIAAAFKNGNDIVTAGDGILYETGYYVTDEEGEKTFYPGATVDELTTVEPVTGGTKTTQVCIYPSGDTVTRVNKVSTTITTGASPVTTQQYFYLDGTELKDAAIIASLKEAAKLTDLDGEEIYVDKDAVTEIQKGDGILMIVYDMSMDVYEGAELRSVTDKYIYQAAGSIMETTYLVSNENGTLITNDYGVLKDNGDGTYTLTYTEAIYDPDINYNYKLTYNTNQTLDVKMVTGSYYLAQDGTVVRALKSGGYSVELPDGTVTEYPDADLALTEENTGNTYDFVYEERPLADATYVVKAAEDIASQDGQEGNFWFKKGDVVATVTTANDGEIVGFAPVYNVGGKFDKTYYYGNSNHTYNSLTQEEAYGAADFATTGSIKNRWTASEMSALDLAIFGIPAFTDSTIYPNTFYREDVERIYRRFNREGVSTETIATDYQTRLEAYDGLESEGAAVLTATPDGFALTNTETVVYDGADLKPNSDYFILEGTARSGEKIDIEVKESKTLYEITDVVDTSAPWEAGDYVEKSASGYRIVHNEASELGVEKGSLVDAAKDLGYTVTEYYPDGVVFDNGNGNWTLYDDQLNEIVKMKSGVLVTEAGGIVKETANGYEVTYTVREDITANQYVTPTLTVKGATLVLKDDTYELSWDSASQKFVSTNGTSISFNNDYSVLAVATGGSIKEYQAFDLLVEYDFHYAVKENIVEVEKDGQIGMVSLYLPLGKYTVEEVKTPYGFLIDGTVQTVEFKPVDQVKEIVFNTNQETTDNTQMHMDTWIAKGLNWFVGGANTLSEHLDNLLGVNFFTWGTYGDGEVSFFKDAQAFVHTFDQRVKAWSEEEVPDKPDAPGSDDKNDRHPESTEHQWKLGVGIYKADKISQASLRGAKFGLWTKDDIYNADGKLLIAKDTLLAVATTDETGHANFAVDIALMSKKLDQAAADPKLIFEKTISYPYDSMTVVTGAFYAFTVEGCDDVILEKQGDGTYLTETGLSVEVNETEKTITYLVDQSIDGNTANNTGDYYIKELTPPEGYLYDDTVYEVDFRYDDDTTMYIPVYAEHENVITEATLTKYELTGSEEVEGATISVYKIKDVNDRDADGLLSHEAENLDLIETWVSTDDEHVVKELLLSNGEWPRLPNEEDRENIYIFREEIPAAGYTTAKDIEFKLYQVQGQDGWIDSVTGEPYGYEVLVNHVTCNEDIKTGSIISPNDHADSWFHNQTDTESKWDYTKVLDGYTEVKWLLVNENLVLFFAADTNKLTVDKILQEEDFKDLTFDTVYLEFADGMDAFEVDFHTDKQVSTRPADSIVTYQQMWYTLDDMHVSMYDDTTKMVFNKQDIVTGEDVIGAHLQIVDSEGNVIDEWITEEGVEHYIEGVLEVNKEYTLVETLAPTEDGYVKSNSVKFTVLDDGSIQRVVMQDDFTKLEISKADLTTGEEVDGAMLEIWSVDNKGNKKELIEKWTTGSDGYDQDGKPNRHYIDYLPIGKYVLIETQAPDGYILAEDVEFEITETGLLQKVQMFDASSALTIYKYRTGTKKFVKGAHFNIYAVPDEYVEFITNGAKIETDAAIVDTSTDTDFVVNTEVKGSVDLASYLTGVSATGTEHRDSYTTTMTLDYSFLKADLTNLVFTQVLPEAIVLDSADLGTEHTVKDNGVDAFTYVFGKNTDDKYTLTVTFDSAYAQDPLIDVYNIYVTIGATIADSAIRGNGSLKVDFTDSVALTIAKEDILEIESSITEPDVTVKLTEADLVAKVVTEDKPTNVYGLIPGWYVAVETKAPGGYRADPTPQVFRYLNVTGEQALTFYNSKKSSSSDGGSEGTYTPAPAPGIGKLTLSIDGGWWWNNVRTEDTGEEGSSIILSMDATSTIPYGKIAIILFAAAAGCAGALLILLTKKRKSQNR